MDTPTEKRRLNASKRTLRRVIAAAAISAWTAEQACGDGRLIGALPAVPLPSSFLPRVKRLS
jgi:hypothetical protein